MCNERSKEHSRQHSLDILYVVGERITRIGNAIVGSPSGVDVAGAIFLLNDVLLEEGVVFAFSAYFRVDTLVSFQIWRPIESNDTSVDTSNFRLIGQLQTVPSVVNFREDVSMGDYITCSYKVRRCRP